MYEGLYKLIWFDLMVWTTTCYLCGLVSSITERYCIIMRPIRGWSEEGQPRVATPILVVFKAVNIHGRGASSDPLPTTPFKRSEIASCSMSRPHLSCKLDRRAAAVPLYSISHDQSVSCLTSLFHFWCFLFTPPHPLSDLCSGSLLRWAACDYYRWLSIPVKMLLNG